MLYFWLQGSPLGGYDQQIIKNKKYLNENNIFFQPGINEELAATSLWGTQQVNLRKKINMMVYLAFGMAKDQGR